MSLIIDENVDFGTVEVANYSYVNFMQGPDFMMFRMSPEAAQPFMDRINRVTLAINDAWKEINKDELPIDQGIYQTEEENNPGTVTFTAMLLDPMIINGKWGVDDREALKAIDKLEVGQKVKVHGDLIAVRDDFGIMIQLQLAELEVEE
jgi:hypothetical protein